MDWLNLHTSILDSPEVLGADPIDRATWLMLLRFCIGQENSGIIKNAKTWNDRKWQQIVRVTLSETQAKTQLWTWHGDDLHVTHYPLEKEAIIKGARLGGKAKTQAKTQAARHNGAKGGRPKTQPITQGKTQQKGREGEGKGMEGEVETACAGAAAPQQSAASAAIAEKLINAHPRPSLARPALEAALETVRRFHDQLDVVEAKTRQYAAAVAEWPEDERLTYLTTCRTWFEEDRWRDHPDTWKSRRSSRKAIAQADAPPPIDIGGRRHKTLAPAINGHTTTTNLEEDDTLKF
jgi:hypothetical protein